ncbi:hypothetical protein Back11_23900 [Paenibacillus baekrokdamisoli]|uniref:DUF2953 domain-containing protein n=2 Tax=Paenibacillus baekrokdamisoli TaxID=1712516 RepID=A0A3G9IY25_9BACL|nr:DUF2953 domain-containing protein [Paenibacillus baekrokdamisoli]BBH21045.1 hypothetical protein Back11_23900 [Paenibacillus baekrokdamisoli]
MLGYPYGWLIGTGLFCLLLFLMAMTTVVIHGQVKRVGDNDDAELRIRALFGLIHYHWKLPIARLKGMGMDFKQEMTGENMGGIQQNTAAKHVDGHSIIKSIETANMLLKQTDDLFGWVRRTLAHIRLTEWKWQTKVGTGDAMWTAMITGMLWSVKTTSIGVLSQLVRLKIDPKLEVEPIYARAYFSTEGEFTAKINFGYAMYAGIHLMQQMKKSNGISKGLMGWQRILLRG